MAAEFVIQRDSWSSSGPVGKQDSLLSAWNIADRESFFRRPWPCCWLSP